MHVVPSNDLSFALPLQSHVETCEVPRSDHKMALCRGHRSRMGTWVRVYVRYQMIRTAFYLSVKRLMPNVQIY